MKIIRIPAQRLRMNEGEVQAGQSPIWSIPTGMATKTNSRARSTPSSTFTAPEYR
jgi:hypothetical protein